MYAIEIHHWGTVGASSSLYKTLELALWRYKEIEQQSYNPIYNISSVILRHVETGNIQRASYRAYRKPHV